MTLGKMKITPIVPFLERFYILPDGNKVHIYPHQKAILEKAFAVDKDGKIRYKTIVYSAPKKSGKSAMGAMVALWFAFSGLCEPHDEIYTLANDLEGTKFRIYQAIKRGIEAQSLFRDSCRKILDHHIETNEGTTITPLSCDYAGVAGANPGLTISDELWGAMSESARRLFEETVPVPTRRNSFRVIVSYAGWVGESILLEDIYKKVVQPENRIDLGKFKNYATGEITDLPVYVKDDTFCYWDHEHRMPWQTAAYLKEQLMAPGFRESAFRRLHYNEWIDAEEGLDLKQWQAAIDRGIALGHEGPPGPSTELSMGLGVDAATVKDRAAVVGCFRKEGMLYLGPRMTWQPSHEEPLHFESTLERYIIELCERYFVPAVYYDPWQFESSAQRLSEKGIPMIPWHQTQPNTILMTEHLLDLLRDGQIVLYQDDELTREAQQVSLKEMGGRGRRIVKTSSRKKIDSIIALTMAALATMRHVPDFQSLGSQILPLRLRR